MSRTVALLFGACSTLFGCAASAPSWRTVALEGASAPAAITPPKTRTFVVWSGGEDAQTSRLISVSGNTVTELGEAEGAMMVWDDRAYRFVAEASEAPLYGCDFTGGNQPELPEKAVAHRGVLLDLGTDARFPVTSAPDTSGANEYNDSIDLQASIGPYLFVAASEWTYACGAHGNANRSELVWDLRSQSSTELLTAPERARIDEEERSRARDALDGVSRFGSDEPLALEDVALVEAVPAYNRGLVTLDLHFATAACYACSDGEWTSYSVSTHVSATSLPSSIARFGKPLAWLGAYMARRDLPIGGVSEIDDARKVPGLLEAMHPPGSAPSERSSTKATRN